MTDSVIVEGYARLREGKKWKTRWVVLRKPSPVADCVLLLVFKDKSDKSQNNKERASITLEEICGLEIGQWYEGVTFTLAILCLNQAALLGFDSKETLQAWDIRLRYSLGEVHRFSVGILPGTKLESGPATLHLCNNLLTLARNNPPVIIAHWNLPDLRRYGPVPNGFVFEGGTRCGYWAGVFLLASTDGEQISFLFDCIVRGISPTRGPFGLRPILPELRVDQTQLEEKLNLEAEELERRLSMLSHGSSAVSSTGGDDRSISGSSDTSDTSQSDCSAGSRLVIWTEPMCGPTGNVSHPSSKLPPLQITEKLATAAATHRGGTQPAAKSQRQLQEIGRQSSSDSGIATGSHSSYSGSFSSYAGSLDINAGEEFGSVFCMPPHLAQDLCRCTCPAAVGFGYQAPMSSQSFYDTPKSLRQETSGEAKECEAPMPTTDLYVMEEEEKESLGTTLDGQSGSEASESSTVEEKKTNLMPPNDFGSFNPSHPKTIVIICSVCGGFKGTSQSCISSTVIPLIPARESPLKSRVIPGSGSLRRAKLPTEKTSEPSVLPKKGRKYVRLLWDLLVFPKRDKPLGPKGDELNLYESMRSALEKRPNHATCEPFRDSARWMRGAEIYENCLRCQVAHFRPRLPAVSKETHKTENIPILQTGEESAVDGEERVLEGARAEKMRGRAVIVQEEKKLNIKEQRLRTDPAYEIMENRVADRNFEAGEKSKYELMGSYSHKRFLQEADGAALFFSPETLFSERPPSESVTYVNIPVSPTSKKQLNYMELELQEPGHGPRGANAHLSSQGKASTKYAQIDITATETAHKVGAQHALGRQEGLHTLELRKKGTLH